jgi:CMP/dCMP kinase
VIRPDRPFIVAIDGPAGAGKSSASRRLAERLGFTLIDTGAIYRTVALAASEAGIAFDDSQGLADLLPRLAIRFEAAPAGGSGGGQRVMLDGRDVSDAIRTPAMSLGASAVSALPVVRAGLLDLQRQLAAAPGTRGSVLEGRDIGTVVFPDADAKFFITASAEVRAHRRWMELQSKGDRSSFQRVLDEQTKRDRDDTQRAIAPMRPATDAVVLDTSELSLDQVVDHLAADVESRLARREVAE